MKKHLLTEDRKCAAQGGPRKNGAEVLQALGMDGVAGRKLPEIWQNLEKKNQNLSKTKLVLGSQVSKKTPNIVQAESCSR